MEIRPIESIEESKRVFPVMKELRAHLDESKYLELLQSAKAGGYKLAGIFDGDRCLGLMGYRVLFDFAHGKHLYIDDLVIAHSVRSNGLGARLLCFAKDTAASLGCNRLRLCTGTDNESGKRFYEKNGWELKAVVYKSKLV